MTDEERNKIYTAYGKAVMWHNGVEFILEQFLATELSKIRQTMPLAELTALKRSAPEFGKKLEIFKQEVLSKNSDVRLQTICDSFIKVGENRKYLAHAATAEAGALDESKNFQTKEFIMLEWTKKDGTVVPQQPLTTEWLEKITEEASIPIALIQDYWVPKS